MTAFADRVRDVPTLGLGISTEYGAAAAPSALDPLTLRATYPAFAAFLEIGVEVSKGLDDTARRWVHEGFPTTYHFLDLNLEDEEDFDAPWLTAAARLAAQIQPAWVCGERNGDPLRNAPRVRCPGVSSRARACGRTAPTGRRAGCPSAPPASRVPRAVPGRAVHGWVPEGRGLPCQLASGEEAPSRRLSRIRRLPRNSRAPAAVSAYSRFGRSPRCAVGSPFAKPDQLATLEPVSAPCRARRASAHARAS